jgi:hypothetical protein
VQLEVAAMALRSEIPVCLERSGSASGAADVVLGGVGNETVTEVKIVLLDETAAETTKYDEALERAS